MVAQGDKGFLVQAADGLPVFLPFGGAAEVCGGGEPSLYATVSGTVAAASPIKIRWCGETWLLPRESGTEKLVCPSVYSKTYSYNTTGLTNGVFWDGKEVWDGGGGFVLRAQARSSWLNSMTARRQSYYNYRDVYFGAVQMYTCYYQYSGYQNFYWALASNTGLSLTGRPWAPTSFSSYDGGASVMTDTTDAPNAVAGGYRISDDQMGSYTENGITFSWRKGSGW